jgi:tripartite-type tricarboxylate transporter receptor subunit TctC
MLTRRSCLFGMVAAGLHTSAAWSGEFPTRPVTLIAPVSPGASADVTLRALAAATEKYLGQPIIVENMPGAGATMGPARVAASKNPDGYMLTTIFSTVFRMPFLRKTTFDPTTDFTYITGVARIPIGVVVRSDAPWQTFDAFLAYAKANPGKISYGTGGVGTTSQIVMAHVAKQLGIDWVHVPFKEGASGTALLGGFIQAVADPAFWAPLVRSGQLRLLVTFGPQRTRSWPTVPTLKESGVDIVGDVPYGIAGPRGMDAKIVKRLQDAFAQGFEDPAFAATLTRFNEEPFYLNSGQFHDFAMSQITKEKGLVEELGMLGTMGE